VRAGGLCLCSSDFNRLLLHGLVKGARQCAPTVSGHERYPSNSRSLLTILNKPELYLNHT
ncbi:MAG: hypothetical protein RLP02_30170, partial [Coleofasciculus sp. C2-GNP5-27]